MLDDLRSQADSNYFEEDDTPAYVDPGIQTKREFMGMTPGQRLILALLLLVMTIFLSTFCLLISGRIVLPS